MILVSVLWQLLQLVAASTLGCNQQFHDQQLSEGTSPQMACINLTTLPATAGREGIILNGDGIRFHSHEIFGQVGVSNGRTSIDILDWVGPVVV